LTIGDVITIHNWVFTMRIDRSRGMLAAAATAVWLGGMSGGAAQAAIPDESGVHTGCYGSP
jgi:hypothetical protein